MRHSWDPSVNPWHRNRPCLAHVFICWLHLKQKQWLPPQSRWLILSKCKAITPALRKMLGGGGQCTAETCLKNRRTLLENFTPNSPYGLQWLMSSVLNTWQHGGLFSGVTDYQQWLAVQDFMFPGSLCSQVRISMDLSCSSAHQWFINLMQYSSFALSTWAACNQSLLKRDRSRLQKQKL